MTDWPRGTRLRCLDNLGIEWALDIGHTYTVDRANSEFVWLFDDNEHGGALLRKRFKPIVRVKAPSRKGCCNKGCTGCEDFAFRARLHRFATSGDLA